MNWLRGLALIGLTMGAVRSFRAMGKPIRRGGMRWYRQPDGRYRRWYGGRSRREEELGPPDL